MIDFNEKMMRAALREAMKAERKEEIPIDGARGDPRDRKSLP